MSIRVAIIKPADNGCNLHCNYCYVEGNPSQYHGMDMKTAEKIVDELFTQNQNVTFLWHGGEPLLREISFYENIFDYQKKQASKKNIKYSNSFQTNLTLFNEEWAKFFLKNNITISTSIDGPQHLHDENRRFANEKGSFNLLVEKIKLAKSFSLKINALCVISKSNLNYPLEVCDNFNKLGISHVGFLPCYKEKNGIFVYPSLSPGEYGKFMVSVFQFFLNGQLKFNIREFEQVYGAIIGKKPSTCCFSGSCFNFICIDSYGNIFPCDTSYGIEKFKLGNIHDDSLEKIYKTTKYKSYMDFINNTPDECNHCLHFDKCHNGCPNMRINDKYIYCIDRKLLFDYVENEIKHILNSNKYLSNIKEVELAC